VEKIDAGAVKSDAGAIDPEIVAEPEESAMLFIKQEVHYAVAPSQCGDDANLVHALATLLSERIHCFGYYLRRESRDAKEYMLLRLLGHYALLNPGYSLNL
jgi:hypothetical protein